MTGVIATIPKFFFESNGIPLVGGTLQTYLAGTTTPTSTWQDLGLTVLNTNPIILDARGECLIWLDSTKTYKFVLKDATGVTLWTVDNIGQPTDSLRTDLAASTGSTLVGFMPTGIGATVSTVHDALDIFMQYPSGQVFQNFGARVNRIRDRLLIADAAVNDANYPNVTKDWLSTFQVAAGLSNGAVVSAQAAVLSGLSTSFSTALLGGSQSLGSVSAGASCIGVQGYAINNNASLATSGWAFYGEAHKTTAASAGAYGMELDTRTIFASMSPTPYQQGTVVGLQLASGAGLSATGQFDASAAIQIESNPMKFKAGIVFGSTSITGTDGVTGSGVAIAFAKGHSMMWYNSGGQQTSQIQCTVATSSNAMDLFFADAGITLTNTAGAAMALFPIVASPVNYPSIYSGPTGGPVGISAIGADTDISINLDAKGAGLVVLGHSGTTVRFGTYTATPATSAGYIPIQDSSGVVRKLMVGT
jgi:hypothetical protein